MRNRLALAVSAVLMFVVFSADAEVQSVEPAFVREAIGLRTAAAAPHFVERADLEPLVTLAPAALAVPEEIDAIREWNAQGHFPAKNGFTRAIGGVLSVRLHSGAAVQQQSVTGIVTETTRGTKVWSGSIRVEGAYRMRVHLKNVAVPPGTTFWVYGRAGEPIAFGTELIDSNGEVYTPSVSGDIAYIEMELPAGSPGAAFDIADVLELVGGGARTNDAPTCLLDATCTASATFSAIDIVRQAVADLFYVKAGSGFVCTGGLLNDADTTTTKLFLLTANHCLSTQAVATTLESFWDYRTSTCNGAFPDMNASPRSNGSTLLATGTGSDFTLVQLNSVPAGRGFLGWTTAALTAGTTVFRVSHPFPDAFTDPAPQRFSTTLVNTTSGTCSARPRGPYVYSTLSIGGVYGGSSGSPVVLANGQVVGQLFGACGPTATDGAGCDVANQTVDGAFATTFPSISSFINTQGNPNGCTPNATTACMLNNRFKVTVRYRGGFDNSPADSNASVKSVTGFANASFETGFFFFNSESNIEMLVKILDQGNTNGSGQPTIAVLFGCATPLRVELTIFDTLKSVTKTYTSNFNSMAGATDFTAFVK